jgi:predicted glycoside hydrolase/deacetylase ChbG (UPF0249 family)
VERRLIVNADDFGRSAGVNRGVTDAFEHGIVTSASLMVRWPFAREAAEHEELDLGLHVDLGEWIHRDGRWEPLYERVPLDDGDAVAAELDAQLAEFRRLTGREPSHLDSHQHVHRDEPAASAFAAAARALGIPLRGNGAIRYLGDFYGQSGRGDPHLEGISVERLVELIRNLPPGTTELGCHPGYAGDDAGAYAAERAVEVAVLCDPAVRAAVAEEGVVLGSFADFA